MSNNDTKQKKGFFNSFLNGVEVVGNKLPHPATIFLILTLVVIVASAIFEGASVDFYDARKKEEVVIKVISLLNPSGLRYMLNSATKNFIGFAPMGTVLVAMLGVGIAEETGLIGATLKKIVLSAPKRFITAIVVLMGVMSNIAADAGYVVLIPLGAIVFISFGRHPMAGIAAAFAGVSGGFSANLLLGTLDPLLAGITNEAIKIAGSDRMILPTSNYYFLFVSTFLLTAVGTFVTEKIVEPRLGEYKGEKSETMELSEQEKKGLGAAGITMLAFIALMLFLTVPENALLKEAVMKDGVPQGAPNLNAFVHDGLVPVLSLFFFLPGIAYGFAAGTIKNDKDIAKGMGKSMSSMGSFLVLAFAASQFIGFFNYSNLGTMIAVSGARGLEAIGFKGLPLIIAFVLLSSFINLFMGSASAKWAIMAPIFIPMFIQLGIAPEFTQLAYRVGDSSTNIISPLMTYFALIITFMQKYDKDAGMGTLISTMLPYSMAFLLFWTILLIIWFVLGLPIGPGAVMLL